MNKKDKIEQIKAWHREGKIKRLGCGCFSVPSEAFGLGITPRLITEVLKADDRGLVEVWRTANRRLLIPKESEKTFRKIFW